MTRCFRSILFLAAFLATASPVWSQTTPQRTISLAKMFLYSDSLIGLLIIWLLLLMSAVSIGLTIKLALDYRRSHLVPASLQAELERLLKQKNYDEALYLARRGRSYLGRLAYAALGEMNNGYTAMQRSLEEASDALCTGLLRPIEYLNVLGNIAPMIGLFGTVYGMIVAFQKLVSTGGSPDPVQLAGGISTALVTTFWGLVVAIPALAAYALIRNQVDSLAAEGVLVVEQLIMPFKDDDDEITGI